MERPYTTVNSQNFNTEGEAIAFYESLPELYPDPASPTGGLGGRHYPIAFLIGNYWIVMFILFFI